MVEDFDAAMAAATEAENVVCQLYNGGGDDNISPSSALLMKTELSVISGQQHGATIAAVADGGRCKTTGEEEQDHLLMNLPDIQELTADDTVFILCSETGKERIGGGDVSALQNELR